MSKINLKDAIISFSTIFLLTLIVSAFTTFFYNLIVHKSGIIDWNTSFTLAIIFSIVLTWINLKENKK